MPTFRLGPVSALAAALLALSAAPVAHAAPAPAARPAAPAGPEAAPAPGLTRAPGPVPAPAPRSTPAPGPAAAVPAGRPVTAPPPAPGAHGHPHYDEVETVPYACAAEGWPWSCVASCESSGRWDLNTGNGFYGGLQFRQSTWEQYGGLGHAKRADLATKEQQITVAQEVLRWQGWGAWPECSKKYGLSGRAHTVQPGDTLSAVARRFSVKGGWEALYAANKAVVGPDPGKIKPGMLLTLP
ncbi:LysM peptidoglycan-binding domain-containing protein [Streptomyces sp. LP05-1]|uniref:LysM peptidoglycan-binding domain-containing protein n=1 Tax=Streptomyces pyxinae TaxID=2970734 RepID=A0ABT2CLL5_9ACTN|nr:LysM peptidoglycan-binding domain-containing protein [Streptomyces sp. LP05-1]MCS0638318.1 LysM peptidoglycan-binding domain-containing protein [Streptomyces sp. LP05-1]